jgi:hypothetical protein
VDANELFDYAPIMTKMEKLQRKIHDNFLSRKLDANKELVDELLFTVRQLQLFVRESSRDNTL